MTYVVSNNHTDNIRTEIFLAFFYFIREMTTFTCKKVQKHAKTCKKVQLENR